MSISNKVIKISGSNVERMVLGENAIQLMSKSGETLEEFNETWNKTMTMATKREIKYNSIKSITKEEGEDELKIKYKGIAGVANSEKLSFLESNDKDEFYNFLQSEKGFLKTEEKMSPIKSALPYLGGLALTLFLTAFGYYQSIELATGNAVELEGYSRAARRERFFNSIIETLGTNGVLLLGIAISAYTAYMIWKRYKNPPVQTQFMPKN